VDTGERAELPSGDTEPITVGDYHLVVTDTQSIVTVRHTAEPSEPDASTALSQEDSQVPLSRTADDLDTAIQRALELFGDEIGNPDPEHIISLLIDWASSDAATPLAVAEHDQLIAGFIDTAVAINRPDLGARLASATAPLTARSRHWDGWRRILALGRIAAERASDHRALAYLTHEEGVRLLLTGQPSAAASALDAAVAIWRQLGDANSAILGQQASEIAKSVPQVEPKEPTAPEPPEVDNRGRTSGMRKVAIGIALVVAILAGGFAVNQVVNPAADETQSVRIRVVSDVAELAPPGALDGPCPAGAGKTNCTTTVSVETDTVRTISVVPKKQLPAGAQIRYWGCQQAAGSPRCTVRLAQEHTVCAATNSPLDQAARRECEAIANDGRPSDVGPTARTQAAYVHDRTLVALDNGRPHSVRDVDIDGSTYPAITLDWSTDHTRLFAANKGTVFSWSSQGSAPAEDNCGDCDVTYVDRPDGTSFVATMRRDGLIERRDPGTLRADRQVHMRQGTAPHFLKGDVNGLLLVTHPRAGVSPQGGPDTLWLVDPMTGNIRASYDPGGNVGIMRVAVSADGSRVAITSGTHLSACNEVASVHLLDATDLTPVAAPEPLLRPEDGRLSIQDLFFNGTQLYAVIAAYNNEVDTLGCTDSVPPSLWRLDGNTWHQIERGPVEAVRPIEGMTDEPSDAKIVVSADFPGFLVRVPTLSGAPDPVNLGFLRSLHGGGMLWSTPTYTEINLAPS
jgi:hypothetical protein